MLAVKISRLLSGAVNRPALIRLLATGTNENVIEAASSKQYDRNITHSQRTKEPPIWEDPWRYIRDDSAEEETQTFTDYVATNEEWKIVEDLLPIQSIPTPPEHSSYPTPSGWYPPDPSPDLPYYVSRTRFHVFPTMLERRRDRINPDNYEIEYEEVVVLRNVEGDVFACEEDLRKFLEPRLGRKIGTHVNELQGIIRIRGADRVDVEAFLIEKKL